MVTGREVHPMLMLSGSQPRTARSPASQWCASRIAATASGGSAAAAKATAQFASSAAGWASDVCPC